MHLKRWLLLSALLIVCVRPVSAQPGCSSLFDPFVACTNYYLGSEYVFVGRVVDMRGDNDRWEKVTVAVETSVKGQVGREVELALGERCYGYVVKGSKYMFTAAYSSEVGGLISLHWSMALNDTPADELAKLIHSIREVLKGAPEPRLWGRVTELKRNVSNPLYDKREPLPGIVVVAENKKGEQTKTITDEEGNFTFDKLPVGAYTVYPILPKKMDLTAIENVLPLGVLLNYKNNEVIENGLPINIERGVCGKQVRFDAEQTGSLAVRLEREQRDWKSEPVLYLFRVGSEAGGLELNEVGRTNFTDGYIRPSHVQPEDSVGSEFTFDFNRVPVGSYILFYRIARTGNEPPLFYPTVYNFKNAELIKVTLGERTDVSLKVPFLTERRIFGRAILPDGTFVSATVRLLDEGEPDGPVSELTSSDGQFEFRFWKGRPFTLSAEHVEERNGVRLRFFARTKRMILEDDTGPVTITLDQIERP